MWVPGRITELCGGEDQVVISKVEEMLKGGDVCPKTLQTNLTGLLHEKAPGFANEIWELLLDGQNQPEGVPTSLLDKEVVMAAMKQNGSALEFASAELRADKAVVTLVSYYKKR